MGGKRAVGAQKIPEHFQFLPVWQLSEKQKIGDFFKSETAFRYKALYQIFYIHSPVEQLSVTGNQLVVHHIVGVDFTDLRETGQNALAADIAQAPFYVVFFIKFRVDLTGFLA